MSWFSLAVTFLISFEVCCVHALRGQRGVMRRSSAQRTAVKRQDVLDPLETELEGCKKEENDLDVDEENEHIPMNDTTLQVDTEEGNESGMQLVFEDSFDDKEEDMSSLGSGENEEGARQNEIDIDMGEESQQQTSLGGHRPYMAVKVQAVHDDVEENGGQQEALMSRAIAHLSRMAARRRLRGHIRRRGSRALNLAWKWIQNPRNWILIGYVIFLMIGCQAFPCSTVALMYFVLLAYSLCRLCQ